MDKNPEADRRLMIALVLTMLVMYVWSTYISPPPTTLPSQTASAPAAPTPDRAPASADAAPSSDAVADALPVEEAVPEASVALSGDGYDVVLDSTEGALSVLTLSDYRTEATVTPIWQHAWHLIKGEAAETWTAYQGGGDAARLLTDHSAFVLAGGGDVRGLVPFNVSQASDGLVASRALPGGLKVTKTFKPGDKPHTLSVSVQFQNQGAQPISGLWVGVADTSHKLEGRFDNVMLPVGMADGDIEHLEDPAKVAGDARLQEDGPVQWLGYSSRYFMAALLPADPASLKLVFDALPDGREIVYALDEAALAPGQSRVLEFTAFVGPKDLSLLEAVGNDLDDAVEYGFFGFFSKILLFLLEVFQKGVSNWGVAIILLTLLVKLLFFPLTQKSYVSSKRMQQLQPAMNALKEQYKDDPTRQQQEMMKLFQDNNVNPLGGCLPTLVQLPVWFGLYSTLLYSVELYNSKFLYLHDLTASDPYGLLPTLVAVLFYLQQAMTPTTGMDPTQQKMMRLMPIIFSVFMYSLPSGLVLYITVNSILSIAQMWVINKTLPAPSPVK